VLSEAHVRQLRQDHNLYFSLDNWMMSYHAAERKVRKMIEAIHNYEDGRFRKSDFVTVKRNVLADVEVKVSLQSRFGYDEEDIEGMIEEVMGSRAGIFKLESSEQLTPLEALEKYRARATVEHLIHSLKRITGLKPLRVRSESSIRGSMMLALLSETVMAMARYEMKPRKTTMIRNGRKAECDTRPSTESMVWFLGHLTVTRIIERSRRKEAHFSNWDDISREVFDNIRSDHEGRWFRIT